MSDISVINEVLKTLSREPLVAQEVVRAEASIVRTISAGSTKTSPVN
jgi:hypothetical protein